MIANFQMLNTKTILFKMLRFFLVFNSILLSNVANCQCYNVYPIIDINAGLPHNEVNDIVKDEAGFIWIATENGISRFDGYNFINFNHQTHPSIFNESRITKLYKKGSIIYLITATDGLIELKTKSVSFKKLYQANTVAMAFSNDTTAILFETGKLLLKVKSKVVFSQKFNVYKKSDLALYQGKIIISLNNRDLIVLDPRFPSKRSQIRFPNTVNVGNFIISKKHGLIIWNRNFVRILRNNKIIFHPDFIKKRLITYFSEEPDGRIMYIEKNKIPYVIMNQTVMALFSNENKNLLYRSICRISESSILIATNQGLIKIEKTPALSRQINDFTLDDSPKLLIRRKIIQYQNKVFYTGAPRILEENGSKLSAFSNEPFSFYDGLIFKKELYCTTEGRGLISFNLQTHKRTSQPNKFFESSEVIESISIFSDSCILLCGGNKMVLYNPINKKSALFKLKNGIVIHSAVIRKNLNSIYLGTSKGLFRVQFDNKNNFKIIDSGIYPNLDIRDILLREKSKEIWLATYSGVFVLNLVNLNTKHEYSKPHTVSHPKVVKLLEDKQNRVWASTFAGITIYDQKNQSIRFIDQSQGLYNFEYNNKSGCLLNDGKLAFGGLNAFEIIDPNVLNEFKYAKSFDISGIETLQNENKKLFSVYQKGQKINFNTGKEALKIYLSNLDFQFGAGYSFQYSLDSKNWFNADKKNWILISNLAYGEYELKIRMYNPFGQLVKEKLFLISANTPFFYKTGFLSVVFILFIVFCLLFVFLFIRSLRIKAATKSRIAMDLHDESGTILTRLLMLSTKENIHQKEQQQLQSGLKEALYNFRTYIDSISREKHILDDLIDELREFVTMSCADLNIQVEFLFEFDKKYSVKGELFRDIKLSVFEIVTNCIKHSKADKLSLSFLAVDNKLNLIISDTGICNISDLDSYKGNGIRNIKKRIQRNKGHFKYHVLEDSTGLIIEINLPLS